MENCMVQEIQGIQMMMREDIKKNYSQEDTTKKGEKTEVKRLK